VNSARVYFFKKKKQLAIPNLTQAGRSGFSFRAFLNKTKASSKFPLQK